MHTHVDDAAGGRDLEGMPIGNGLKEPSEAVGGKEVLDTTRAFLGFGELDVTRQKN
jgi:hypothetical protein